MDDIIEPYHRRKKGKVREYIEAIASAVLIALLIRSFAVEAFKIPSASMVPTLMIGDHIFVNKFIYGLRIPFTKVRFFQYRTPLHGDIIVFIYPEDEGKDFIKRVVGLPGDKIRVDGDDLYVNDVKQEHTTLSVMTDPTDKRRLLVEDNPFWQQIPFVSHWQDFNFFNESLGDVNHLVQYERDLYHPEHEYTVPAGHLFAMGDNRDHSSDSREWGFVPMDNIKGQAMFVWLSWDSDHGGIRWKRFGHWIR